MEMLDEIENTCYRSQCWRANLDVKILFNTETFEVKQKFIQKSLMPGDI